VRLDIYKINIIVKEMGYFMKLNLIFILLLINFPCKSALSSDNKNQNNIIHESNPEQILDRKDVNDRKFHTVKKGETLLSISKMYSLDKKFIIEINQIENENYIFIGQKLKLTNKLSNNLNNQNKNIPKFHKILEGENLTDISNKYGLKINDLINLNNLDNPDNIEAGINLLLINPSENIEQTMPTIPEMPNKDLLDLKRYGPLTLKSTELEIIGGRKTLQVINKNKTELILSLKCDTKQIDVRKKGRKWKGWMPVKEKFEEKLMNDFC